ncbi:unconventional myosin-IXa-like isoform X2 [Patiria miniata]|uniref:Unconventional myosin-IXb-like n=1 Tax=Patiria miniata TaxID=46514 RepID=A0A914BBC4_PATMI|nr:unconventional myosin-IXa-like isoform X2 [Patiria miniata]
MSQDCEVDNTVYRVRVHPGSVCPERGWVSIEATKQTTTAEALRLVLAKLNLTNNHQERYNLAEVCEESGQSCKERQLDPEEYPVKLQLLWPKVLSDDESEAPYYYTNYRFFLRSMHDTLSSRVSNASDYQTIDSFVSNFFPHPSTDKEYHDLCNLPDLNEKTLLGNLATRFRQGKIYTYVGSILIAVNPFKFFPIYNPKYVNLYQNHSLGELPPHIFAIADSAFHTMLEDKRNQCIVISGESGSGKTESTNLLIHHLTALSRKGHASGVEQTLLGAGPVLEAFGNAKTVVNNNSSRFGKFIQINYRENGTVHGAIVEQYLLEKSRIVSQAPNERNYHVFYYLLQGAEDVERESLWLEKPQDYFYLNQSNCFTLEGVDEKYEYTRLKQSMEMVGFSRETMKRIFSVLSAVLHIGNITFRKRNEHEEYVTVKNIATVKLVSDLLKVKQETLVSVLTKRKSMASGDQFVVQYRMSEALATRDALAKGLYSGLFEWIVLQVNHALLSRYEKTGEHQGNSIGVLDIFGFEDFVLNSFEQFCINYANEHLQYYFNQHVFKIEQEEYRREGIIWKNIEFIDNTGCLLLIEKRPTGLLHILNDDCNFPAKDTNGENLLQKFTSHHKNNGYFQNVQLEQASFIIVHYAGKVNYKVKDFREKNTDLMRPEITSVLKNSNLAFVRELVGIDPLAVFRWAIVRAFFRGVSAFLAAGKRYKAGGGEKSKKPKSPEALTITIPARDEEMFRKIYSAAKTYRLMRQIKRHNRRAVHGRKHSHHKNTSQKNGAAQPSIEDQLSPLPGDEERALMSPDKHSLSTLKPSLLNDDSYWKAARVMKKNKSFRGAQAAPAKGLRDLKSMKKLMSRKMVGFRRSSTKKLPPTVSAQFQLSLSKLMETLNQANPFFVRCIKSNSNKEPCRLDEALMMRQLHYTGMLETVRIRQSGYNVRLTFEEFSHRYHLLLPSGRDSGLKDIEEFLKRMELDPKHYQLGKTKVFLRESERLKLQEALHNHVLKRIVTVQKWMRGVLQRQSYLQMKYATLKLQSGVRGMISRKQLRALQRERERRLATIFIQSCWRGYRTRRLLERLHRGTLWLQCYARGNADRQLFERLLDERQEQERLLLEEEERQHQLQLLREKEAAEELQLKEQLRASTSSQRDEAHSSMSDEGILTPDDLEEFDMERKRTRTMESEDGILDGSVESDELLLDDEAPIKTSTVIITDEDQPETPPILTGVERSGSRVKDLAFAYQEHMQRKQDQHQRWEDDSGRDSQDILYPLEEAEDLEAQRLTDADGQVSSVEVKETESPEKKKPVSSIVLPTEPRSDEDPFVSQTPSPRSPFPPADQDTLPTTAPESPLPKDSALAKAKRHFKRRFMRKQSDPQQAAEALGLPSDKPGKTNLQPKAPSLKLDRKFQEEPSTGPALGTAAGGKKVRGGSSNMSIHGMSQWRYPTNKLVSDARELQQMDTFLYNKIHEMKKKGGSDTAVDLVFKKALNEFRFNLITTYSVAMQQEGSTTTLMYKDLISTFETSLANHVKTSNSKTQFPITLGINAFRGFLDEFTQQYKPEKKSKEQRKKKKDKEKEEVFEYLGHRFVAVQFSIPTACEVCSAFLWLMEKGQVCQVCKFTCHKKCCTKTGNLCKGKSQAHVTGKVIGARLDTLVTADSNIPLIIERCLSIVELNGLFTEGIYRRPGPEAKVKELKHLINTEPDFDQIELDSYNMLVIAQVIKSFFREMPEPLLTFELYEEFLRAVETPDNRDRLLSLQDTINKLPTANFDLFERLIFHLARVCLYENYNRMSPNSLSIVYAPCVLKSPKQMNPWEALQDVSKQALCLEVIIREKLVKLKSTLRDIDTLERASTSASLKLSDLRKRKDTLSQQDLRKSKPAQEGVELTEQQREEVEVGEDAGRTTIDGQTELEEVLKHRIQTLEKERQDLTVNLVTLDLGQSASEDENYSTDGLDLDSGDEVERDDNPVSFESQPSPSKLNHLNKNRAPKQEKRKPKKGHRTPGSDGMGETSGNSQNPPPVAKKQKRSSRKGSKKEKKQREGSKERRKRAGASEGVAI